MISQQQTMQEHDFIWFINAYKNTIILIMASPSNNSHIQPLRAYNTQRILNHKHQPSTLNLKLASNPFLKDQQKYHFLMHKLKNYNKRVEQGRISDAYESIFYQNLHSIVCDIVNIDSKQSQIERLQQIVKWNKEQQHLIEQRKDQGQVRYQITKTSKNQMQNPTTPKNLVQTKQKIDLVPSEVIAKDLLPYQRGNRTAHKQIDIPPRRLKEYKRKVLNLTPFQEPKEEKKQPRILYPKIPKFDPKYDDPEENPQQGQEGNNQKNPAEEQPKEGGQLAVDGQPKEGEPNEEQQKVAAQQQQQDLGGFGEQPAEPQQQQAVEVEGQDKLAPKVKSFTIQFSDIKRREYERPYMFFKGQECEAQRRMQQKYMKIINKNLNRKKQEMSEIEYVQQWGKRKSKVQKDRQKKLENKIFNSQYNFSYQDPIHPQTLSPQDQIKYGFTTNITTKPRHSQINLTAHHLPKIAHDNTNLFQKSIRKDRLNSLKKKFGALLNLPQNQEREAAPSICQYSSRKRGFSEVIRKHSKSKERLKQLDEIMRIKEKLARSRVPVDMKSLSMGLCLPEDDIQPPQIIIPVKDLPSNPFMIQTKKKKKKK